MLSQLNHVKQNCK